uniref:hypothetical protein n=1 Tax=Candidatus Kirkpatrickella diaphorinae TaxID=2984322 RepID=UPI0038D04DDB
MARRPKCGICPVVSGRGFSSPSPRMTPRMSSCWMSRQTIWILMRVRRLCAR